MERLFQVISIDEIDNSSIVCYGGTFDEVCHWMKHNAEGFNRQNLSKKCRSKKTEKELFYVEELSDDAPEYHYSDWYLNGLN